MSENNIWILKSKGVESAFGGNEGYPDEVTSHYVYDSTVKNYDKIAKGDIVVISGKKHIEGFGRIENILVKQNIIKKRYRCPVCNSQEHYERKNISPKYKCRNKHEFDTPSEEKIKVDQFTALYESTYLAAPPRTSVKILESYYINRNFYYSIQRIKPDFIQNSFPELNRRLTLSSKVSFQSPVVTITPPKSNYTPSTNDTRILKSVLRTNREGQSKFRDDLFSFYGPKCMLTQCNIGPAIEASHICPYRGKKDNHIANGLLLRRDLHAIFDADLIGIHPVTLKIYIHPSLKNSEYSKFKDQTIKINRNDYGPSNEALKLRWKIFKESLVE
jgi:putative restriction endonuclease